MVSTSWVSASWASWVDSIITCPCTRLVKHAAKAVGKAFVAYLALAAAARAPVRVRAHGYLARPAARNVQHNSDWCPQCLNAGGPRVVYSQGLPARYGVCGDPWNATKHHEPGGKYATPPKIAARYRQGQTIAAKVHLTANHQGRWSLRLCPVPGKGSVAAEKRVLTQECFDKFLLMRADGGGPFTLVPGDTSDFIARYRLPAGLACKRCVLQWTYETGNSCRPPGLDDNGRNLPQCELTPTIPEREGEAFWNCADISIR